MSGGTLEQAEQEFGNVFLHFCLSISEIELILCLGASFSSRGNRLR